MKEAIEKAGIEIVKKSTVYGSATAPVGSGARIYFETQLIGFVEGAEFRQTEIDQLQSKYQQLKDAFEAVEQFCYDQICERHPYSSSKTLEMVVDEILRLKAGIKPTP